MPDWGFYLGCFLGITLFSLWKKGNLIVSLKWSNDGAWRIFNPKDQIPYSFWLSLATMEKDGEKALLITVWKLAIAIGVIF